MSIHIGDRKIAAIYKGDRRIAKVYKGDTLMYSSARLPKEYQEVSYIESTGTQWIDTGVNASITLGLDMKFNYSSTVQPQQTGAIRHTGSYIRHHLQVYQDQIWYGYGVQPDTYSLIPFDTNIHILKVRPNIVQIDDTTITLSEYTFDLGINYYLFARNAANMAIAYTSMRLYYCQLFNNNTLIRNFVPCYRKIDFKPGLYDTVNRVFYTNQLSTGEDFILGPGVLPNAYQLVEYIQNTGAEYIDSGVNPSSITPVVKLQLYMVRGVITTDAQSGVFGTWGPDDTRFGIYYNGIGLGTNVKHMFNDGHLYTVTLNGQDGSAIVNNQTLTGFDISHGFANQNLFIMGRNSDGYVETETVHKLYYCQIFDGTTLIRNFVPCYRKSDGEVGLYDLISDAFYTNQGAGALIKGPDIN